MRVSQTIIVETRKKLTDLIDQFIKGIFFFRMEKPKDGVYEVERGDLLSEITIGQWEWEVMGESGHTNYVPMWSVTTTEGGEIKVKLENDAVIDVCHLSTDEMQAIAEQLEMTFDDVVKNYKNRLLKSE